MRQAVGVTMVLLPCLVMAVSAQETFGRIVRGDGEATLTVFDNRPLERAAQTLAHDYGLHINVEDPLYFWEGDLVESHRTNAGKRVMVPKPLLLEVSFPLASDGQPADVPTLVSALVDRISSYRPFAYRITTGPAGFDVVPTMMRNERGELVPYSSPLNTPVSVPMARRSIEAHAQLIINAVKAASGFTEIGCCTPGAANVDQTEVEFGAMNEEARHALERLMEMRPARVAPARQHMRCQPLERWCNVTWTPMVQ